MEIKKKELEIFRETGVKVAPSGLPLGLFDYCGNRLVLTAACNDKKEENERKKNGLLLFGLPGIALQKPNKEDSLNVNNFHL